MGNEAEAEISKDPLLVEGFRNVSGIFCGTGHSAFISEGQLYTFGSNKHGQLGRSGDEQEPGLVAFPDDAEPIVQASLGAHHSAAITASGDLFTWGWGGSFWSGTGALGQGETTGCTEPIKVKKITGSLGEKATQVACGAQHTLILTEAGNLYSTGEGSYGRLGRGDTSSEVEFEEIDFFKETDESILAPGKPTEILKIGAGANFSAALATSGELWVWGRNDHGQLGLGEEAMGDMYSAESYPRLVPGLASEGHKIVDFVCGESHLVVKTEAGLLFEWGSRTWLEPHEVPVPELHKESLSNIVKLAAGEKYSFVLSADGQLFSWGAKSSGCLALSEDSPKIVVEPTPIASTVFARQKVVDIVASKGRCLAITEEDAFVP